MTYTACTSSTHCCYCIRTPHRIKFSPSIVDSMGNPMYRLTAMNETENRCMYKITIQLAMPIQQHSKIQHTHIHMSCFNKRKLAMLPFIFNLSIDQSQAFSQYMFITYCDKRLLERGIALTTYVSGHICRNRYITRSKLKLKLYLLFKLDSMAKYSYCGISLLYIYFISLISPCYYHCNEKCMLQFRKIQ